MDTSKGAEKINKEGDVKTKVETVDYRQQAGESEPTKENVTVVHLSNPKDDSGGGAGAVLVDAAAAVASKVHSAKDAITGSTADKDTTTK